MSALTNGRWHPPAPAVSVVESDIPEQVTLDEWRRASVLARRQATQAPDRRPWRRRKNR